jgi:HEAT repeat protein
MMRRICRGVAVVIAIAAAPALAQPAGGASKAAPRGKTPYKQLPGGAMTMAQVADLSGPDVERAAKAAEELGASSLPAAHDTLLNALALGLPPAVAAPAMTSLTKHPAPPDVAALRRYAGHHTPGVRIAALTALALYPDPAAHAVIIAGLHDPVGMVRTAAASAAGKGHVKAAIEPLLALMAKGEDSSARALAQLADPTLARQLADQLGKVPETTLAVALGAILKRTDFGPDEARVEIVRAIAKIQDPSAVAALQDYLDSTPKTPARASRTEAQMVVEARLGGGK